MFSLYFGCKKYESPKNLGLNSASKERLKKPLQSRQGTGVQGTGVQGTGIQGTASQSQDEKAVRKKQVASAEACQKQFESCMEHCDNRACEDSCLKFLSACEANLPVELQTLKQK